MAYIDLTFDSINLSADVGDTVYYTNPTTSGGFSSSNEKVLIGNIESISAVDNSTVIKINCEADLDQTEITSNSFVFFSKSNVANISSLRGYYGLVEFKNNSTSTMELMSVGCDVSESSK